MRRIKFYGHYETGDTNQETSKYTWEDLYVAMNSMDLKYLSDEDKVISIEIAEYFLKNPTEAIDGKLKDYTIDTIQMWCREIIDRD